MSIEPKYEPGAILKYMKVKVQFIMVKGLLVIHNVKYPKGVYYFTNG